MDGIVSALKENLHQYVIQLIIYSIPVIWAGGIWLLKQAIDWMAEHYKGKRFQNTVSALYACARLAVASQKDVADQLKKAAADGHLSDEEKQEIKAVALAKLKKIAPDAKTLIKAGLLKDVGYEEYLGNVIEDVVHEKKQ